MDDPSDLLVWLQLPPQDTSPWQAREAMRALEPMLDGAYGDVLVAVSELVTNAVRHADLGPEGRIDFRVRQYEDRIRIEVSDRGSGFTTIPVAAAEPGSDHGWGLALVEAAADRWGIDTTDATTVWMEVDTSSGRPSPV